MARPRLCIVVLLSAMVLVARTGFATNANMIGKLAPDLTGTAWINTEPQCLADLRGKVVLVEFWTYGCHNCRNVEPYVKAWHERYADKGLVVIGIHSPEFSHEHQLANVRQYIHKNDITYAVVTDNNFVIWRHYNNHAWPTIYLIDKQGILRYFHVGEGRYAETEQQIQTLLAEEVKAKHAQ
jgi:thiol-disulfide isomerase/thioredoxin